MERILYEKSVYKLSFSINLSKEKIRTHEQNEIVVSSFKLFFMQSKVKSCIFTQGNGRDHYVKPSWDDSMRIAGLVGLVEKAIQIQVYLLFLFQLLISGLS